MYIVIIMGNKARFEEFFPLYQVTDLEGSQAYNLESQRH
jgi:hypothetical protein